MKRPAKFKPVSATPTGIATALKRAGLSRSQSFSTAVRGYRTHTVGFKAQTPVLLSSKAIATVGYIGKTFGGVEGAADKALTEYARVLTQNGFRPERTAYDGKPKEDGFYLTVYDRDLRLSLHEAGEFLRLIGGASCAGAGEHAISASVRGDEEEMNQAALRINMGFRHLVGAPLERLQGTPLTQAAAHV